MIEEEISKLLQNRSSAQMTAIWQKAKERDLTGLDDEQQLLAKIMSEHEDDLNLHFENAQLVYDPEQEPDSEYDPFLHITVHAIVEAQLEAGDPIEVVQFFNAMRQKNYHRHDAIHLVGQILIYFVYEMTENQKPFDLDTYRRLLDKYKTSNPQEMAELLEKDPLLSDAE